MSSRRLRLYLTAALTLSLGTAACDRPSSVTDPVVESTVAPQYSNDSNGWGQLKKKNLRNAVVNLNAKDHAEVVIGRDGGVITLLRGQAILVIPKNAVKEPTTFRLQLDIGPDVILTASATSRHGKLDDIGEAGFEKPLTLYLSKFDAVAAGGEFAIGEWDGLEFTPLPTRDLGRFVMAQIEHFSRYALQSEYSMAE